MRQNQFHGKVAIVTGSTRGIGKATAFELASGGATVVMNGRDRERLAKAEKELKEVTENVLGIAGDVSDLEQVRELIEGTLREFGRIDILVNNAALSMRGKLGDFDPEAFRSLLDINILGTVNCTILALPHIRKNRGSIVFISSLASISGLPYQSLYSASKMALRGISEALRAEEHESGIHVGFIRIGVSEIAPGKKVLFPDGTLRELKETSMFRIWSHRRVARAIVKNIARRKDRSTLTIIGAFYTLLQATMPFMVKRVMVLSLRKKLGRENKDVGFTRE